ncbi:hypothetical protein OH799_09540 [Nocardia sp. NBC_00881]|uniref:hypothetical protein n=1 Tax=Nocardia sp. NBC_00881 TaxID=2975995 RepID=UPI00386E722C|nr:hypothetical protein OH799_09540 [Nocardia sp. NBC_00881]
MLANIQHIADRTSNLTRPGVDYAIAVDTDESPTVDGEVLGPAYEEAGMTFAATEDLAVAFRPRR